MIDRIGLEIVDDRPKLTAARKPADQSIRRRNQRLAVAIRLNQHAAHAVVPLIAEPDDVAG